MIPAAKLELATDRSLDWWNRVLHQPIHSIPEWEKKMWVGAKCKVAHDALNLRARIDDQTLRRKQEEMLPELLRRMAEAAKNPKLMPPIEADVSPIL